MDKGTERERDRMADQNAERTAALMGNGNIISTAESAEDVSK